MQLNRKNIDQISDAQLIKPNNALFELPEKVLQFGTGVLLRGLPDYYIDKANRAKVFNGRIVVVKSTSSGNTDAFEEQDGLYTTCIQGIENGNIVKENIVNSSISRVVNATTQWQKILDTVTNDNIQIIVSNTTESGIVDSDDDINDNPPSSFPCKLLAVLVRRFESCKGNTDNGFVILPTELISENGTKLKEIVFGLAHKNKLSDDCLEWIANANYFCNTLVDRIVPGSYKNEELHYADKLMIMAEPYSLWAIETDNDIVKDRLCFAQIDKGIILTPSIEKFKEIKLRLLNGSHTSSCALAILSGFATVKDAMNNKCFFNFIKSLLLEEIGNAILSETVTQKDIQDFTYKVLDRFSNPFLEHQWSSIAVNYTEKLKLRCIPILDKYYKKYGKIPQGLTSGFAAYILLLATNNNISDKWQPTIQKIWNSEPDPVIALLSNTEIWGTDLSQYKNLTGTIKDSIEQLSKINATDVIESITFNA
ncbi:MAG: tagaturonate reductase [Chitinophagaceae bacterium]